LPAISPQRPISSEPSPSEPAAEQGSNSQCVHPPSRYDSEQLRAFAPLFTHSTSGELAQQKIQAFIDESNSGDSEGGTGASSYRNRVPSTQISQIAQQFQEWCPLSMKDQVRYDKCRYCSSLTSLVELYQVYWS